MCTKTGSLYSSQTKGSALVEEIYLKYNSEEIIKIRIKRMVQNNQISFNENKYFSKLSITLIIGLCLDVAKLILFNKNKCNNIYFNNNKL